ncbi:unnamed protein product [Rotaria sp. Silwood2]|nr:unnamed protein product [Rotaria sp. Silwood2]
MFDIFIYLSLGDSFNSFWTLNNRFNNLLLSTTNLSLITYKNDELLFSLFATKITRLVIACYYEIIDLKYFPHLHSLTLHGANNAQLAQIQYEILPELVYLNISSHEYFSELMPIVEQVFSNKFSYLRSIGLGYFRTFRRRPSFVQTYLRSISILSNELKVIPLILDYCPSLCYLRVSIINGIYSTVLRSVQTTHPLKRFLLLDQSNKESFENINHVLTYMPNLEYLYLQFLCKQPLSHLARSLSNNVRRLCRFDCYITEPIMNNQIISCNSIRKLHSCFNRIKIRIKNYVNRTYKTDFIEE